MTKRFVFFNTYNGFTSANKGVDYDDESIVFIKDRKLIYTNETGFNAIPDGGTSGDILTFDGTNYIWQSPDNIQVNGQDLSDILNDKVSYDDLQNYYTKSEVDTEIETAVNDLNIEQYETIEGAESKYQPKGEYYTKAETDNQIETATADMATQTWVKSQEYLTEHQDLTEYAKSADVTAEIEEKISDLNISQYETIEGAESKYQEKGDYLTEHQDLTEYAKKTEVTSEIKTAIDELVNGASSTMDTLKELEDAITGNKGIIDTLNSAITEKADRSELDNYYTKEEFDEKGYLTEHQDLSEYAKSADVSEEIEQAIEDLNIEQYETITGAADKYQEKGNYLTEHQSLDNYYTKEQVDQKIEEIDVTDQLTDYETIAGAESKYQPKGEYYTKEEIDKKGYLTEHQSLENYYTKSEVDAAIESVDVSDVEDKIAFVKTAQGGAAMADCTASAQGAVADGFRTEASGQFSHAEGLQTHATNQAAHAEGNSTIASGQFSHAEGAGCTASGVSSHAEGQGTTASAQCAHAEGWSTQATNTAEYAGGRFNKSQTATDSTFWGKEDATLFSVGNGSSTDTRHNAFEVKQDGTFYIADTTAEGEYYEKPMFKLQDLFAEIKSLKAKVAELENKEVDLSNYYTKEETDKLLNPLDCGTY